jgi:hypothetical protein
MTEKGYPITYTISETTRDYSFEIKVLAKDEKTMDTLMERLRKLI